MEGVVAGGVAEAGAGVAGTRIEQLQLPLSQSSGSYTETECDLSA